MSSEVTEIVAYDDQAIGEIPGSPRASNNACLDRSPRGYDCLAVENHSGPHVGYAHTYICAVWWRTS